MTETMPILWQRTIPTDSSSHWDPSQWMPDVVVINLGTNDYNAGGADPSANFQSTYLQFVKQLESAYPGVFVFGAVGPMLGGSSYTSVKTAISNVVSMRSDGGRCARAARGVPHAELRVRRVRVRVRLPSECGGAPEDGDHPRGRDTQRPRVVTHPAPPRGGSPMNAACPA